MLPKAPTAASGVRKVGMPAARSRARASPTVASPSQHESMGLSASFFASATALAMALASLSVLGEYSASTPSIWRSASAAWSAAW